jgi:hypothetical protein
MNIQNFRKALLFIAVLLFLFLSLGMTVPKLALLPFGLALWCIADLIAL